MRLECVQSQIPYVPQRIIGHVCCFWKPVPRGPGRRRERRWAAGPGDARGYL